MFRPCIDLHAGKVTQIVGATLGSERAPRTNFVSERPARWYAELYKADGLRGGHVIMLGPGNEAAAREALAAYPGRLQIGGGITPDNAASFLNAGASHVIVTSWAFVDGKLDADRLEAMVQTVGRERLVLDLSCKRIDSEYAVVSDRWQRITDLRVNAETLDRLAVSCTEFLVHAVDVEGLAAGIDGALVRLLAGCSPLPVTYAGGARSLDDLVYVTSVSAGRVDLTIGSALDIFGGNGVRYADVVAFNRSLQSQPASYSP